jgi:hypothetical protein
MEFWDLIGRLRERSESTTLLPEEVERVLGEAPPEQLASFHREVLDRIAELWTWDHWSVSSMITGRTQIGFRDFCLWVLLQGRSFYERVLSNPRSAAELVDSALPFTRFLTGTMLGVPAVLHRDATGESLESLDPERPLRGTRRDWHEFQSFLPDLWMKFFVTRDRRAIRPADSSLNIRLVHSAAEPLTAWVEIYGDYGYLAEQQRLLSPGQRALHAIYWLDVEVSNGGIDQFLRNSTGILAPDALEGLLLVGAEAHHRVLASALEEFPKGVPSRDRNERSREMDLLGEKGELALSAATKDFYRLPEVVDGALAGYIRSHTEAFFR